MYSKKLFVLLSCSKSNYNVSLIKENKANRTFFRKGPDYKVDTEDDDDNDFDCDM